MNSYLYPEVIYLAWMNLTKEDLMHKTRSPFVICCWMDWVLYRSLFIINFFIELNLCMRVRGRSRKYLDLSCISRQVFFMKKLFVKKNWFRRISFLIYEFLWLTHYLNFLSLRVVSSWMLAFPNLHLNYQERGMHHLLNLDLQHLMKRIHFD